MQSPLRIGRILSSMSRTRVFRKDVKLGSQKIIRKRIARLRDTQPVGHDYGRGSPEFNFLRDVSRRHPSFQDVIGTVDNMIAFRVTENPRFHSKEFCVVLDSGDIRRISLSDVCVRARLPSSPEKLDDAMRNACHDGSLSLRLVCRDSCIQCGTTDCIEVDHVHPFVDIKTNFLKTQSTIPKDFDESPRDGHWRFLERDADFRAAWISFHDEHAVLQPLCTKCHKLKTANDRRGRHSC